MQEKESIESSRGAVVEAAILGPLERAIAQGTDPLTLLDTEDALRSVDRTTALRDLLAGLSCKA